MAVKWLTLRGPFTAGSWQALNGRQMATLKRAVCDKKWLAMLPFLPFVALTETTNGPFMSCLLGPVWTHESIGYPKIDISYLNAAIHYGVQLAQYWHQTWSFNAISRRSAPVHSLALRLRNTKVPVLTYETIGYPKMDINHWDAAILYCIQLAQYCDQTRAFYSISRRSPPLCPLALKLRNSKVPVWTYESIGYPKMDISHWDAVIHYGVQLAKYSDQTRSFNTISQRSPPVYSLALRLRNSKVTVWTFESIG